MGGILFDSEGALRPSGLHVQLLAVCPEPKRCYEKINDDRATYKCAEGPPGSKWNLADITVEPPPSKRARRAYKRAREELAMLEREAQPKRKTVKTL